MPNWCYNRICIEPESKKYIGELLDLYIQWSNATRKDPTKEREPGRFEEEWIGNLYLQVMSEEELDRSGAVCRGSIETLNLSTEDDTQRVYMTCESAWSPAGEDIDAYIIKKKYPHLRLVYMAEEPGNEIYINTDIDRKIFTEEYFIEWDCGKDGRSDSHYIDSDDFELLRDDIETLSGVHISEFSDLTLDSVIKNINDKFHEKWRDKDTYISIHKYEER